MANMTNVYPSMNTATSAARNMHVAQRINPRAEPGGSTSRSAANKYVGMSAMPRESIEKPACPHTSGVHNHSVARTAALCRVAPNEMTKQVAPTYATMNHSANTSV